MEIRGIRLRLVEESDLSTFFEHQRDVDARHMAAFTSKDGDDREAFTTHWRKILDDRSILMRSIELGDGELAGSVGSYVDTELGAPAVTYWLGKDFWGKGIASRALGLFLEMQNARPLYARLAKDNARSLRVLEKHNFQMSSEEVYYAAARGKEIDELVMVLKADG